MSLTLQERALGAYLGLAAGDALGATVEFLMPREIQYKYGQHQDIVGGGWLRLRPGAVTDDTEMSLALGRAIIACGGWNLGAVADEFAAWLKSKPVDVGNTCRRGIRRYLLDGSLAGPPSEGDGGNGAAMRNLPVVLATLRDPEAMRRRSLEQAHLTHNHALSDAATVALAEMTRAALLGGGREACRAIADDLVARHPAFRFEPYPGRASGYVVDTLQTVLHHFFTTDTFEAFVVRTVNCGEDADTTGAIAGMLGGALYGADEIPARWLYKLDSNVQGLIRAQVEALLRLAG